MDTFIEKPLLDSLVMKIVDTVQPRRVILFGSAARGEMRPDSDINFLVEFLPNADVGLMEHAGLMLDLERLLGRKVDLVSNNGFKPRIRSSVLRDARPVYPA